MNASVIAGVDEAGRGSIAGPVVAAACILDVLPDDAPRITDSKQMTVEEREHAYAYIVARCPFGIGAVPADVIDAIGIMAANERAMQTAVADLCRTLQPTYLLIDGPGGFWFDIPHSPVIKGDEKELCIAAASVIAKVTRDRIMTSYDADYPGYGFADHKGYGTESHRSIVEKKGLTPLHRRTFIHTMPSV